MIVLGFEASGLVASVAIVEDNKLLGEYTINHKRTHSQQHLDFSYAPYRRKELLSVMFPCVLILSSGNHYFYYCKRTIKTC